MWYVYLLECSDKSIYTGATVNVEHRFAAHKAGKGGAYTRSHEPVRILHIERFRTRANAQRREAQIKEYSREQKLKLIAGSK